MHCFLSSGLVCIIRTSATVRYTHSADGTEVGKILQEFQDLVSPFVYRLHSVRIHVNNKELTYKNSIKMYCASHRWSIFDSLDHIKSGIMNIHTRYVELPCYSSYKTLIVCA